MRWSGTRFPTFEADVLSLIHRHVFDSSNLYQRSSSGPLVSYPSSPCPWAALQPSEGSVGKMRCCRTEHTRCMKTSPPNPPWVPWLPGLVGFGDMVLHSGILNYVVQHRVDDLLSSFASLRRRSLRSSSPAFVELDADNLTVTLDDRIAANAKKSYSRFVGRRQRFEWATTWALESSRFMYLFINRNFDS